MTGDEFHAVSRMTEALPGSRSVPVGTRVAVLAAPLAPLFGLLVAYLVYHPPRQRRGRASSAFGLDPTELSINGSSARAWLHAWHLPGDPQPVVAQQGDVPFAVIADPARRLYIDHRVRT
jgi:hypothetical protein